MYYTLYEIYVFLSFKAGCTPLIIAFQRQRQEVLYQFEARML